VRRVVLLVIAAVAGLSYGWALSRDPLEPYYEAAVRSMSMSWRNFAFGAFDPKGTITLDKLPGAFWVQALAVRAFGFHTWVMVMPQVVEGVLTVLILYNAVSRLAGPTAGLIAAAVLAASPATVALNRGNISDSLMILLVVLAADATSAAVTKGGQARLVLAAIWVGLAFQAKMIEAWMVLPALGLAYLAAGPGKASVRIRQLVVAGLVAGVVSVAWMTAVTVTPAAARPYVDGSHDNSIFDQVFVYNGFGRFGEQTPLQLLAGQSLGLGLSTTPPARWNRLLHNDLGRDTGWLIPAALIAGVWGAIRYGRKARSDPLGGLFILWGVWLVTLGVVFSVTTTINPYYTAALTPAIAAILGTAVVAVWRDGTSRERIGAAVVVALTAIYGAWLVPSHGTHIPGWLTGVTLVVGALAVGALVASAFVSARQLTVGALTAGVVAILVAPAVASVELAQHHQGAFDTPFEPAFDATGVDGLFITTPQLVDSTIPRLELDQRGAPYMLATQTSAVASVFINGSGREVLPIGGFTGTIPSPTLAQLQTDIRKGRFHLVLAAPSTDPRLAWIESHCLAVKGGTSNLHTYYCLPRDAP
jgi:4-amino-4-deoxy-L-arabinose transferase-like glycosyltransferase